jgi:hypothetical protein
MKIFYTQDNIGKAKYTVSFHNGIDKNKDGSDFFAIAIFHNKKKRKTFIDNLKKQNYIEK